ncbi:hypothetical protein HPB50_006838 [Hyalomma asiaticum]|uniref:Uncharacterized protein n=1 Tax=Hyalomma asiaticum TaxID=266040 RepID=A0ACB7RH55_HYAAI|nr:hypothetical protein HPB50_006838 [Hyalomma asiaticum]
MGVRVACAWVATEVLEQQGHLGELQTSGDEYQAMSRHHAVVCGIVLVAGLAPFLVLFGTSLVELPWCCPRQLCRCRAGLGHTPAVYIEAAQCVRLVALSEHVVLVVLRRPHGVHYRPGPECTFDLPPVRAMEDEWLVLTSSIQPRLRHQDALDCASATKR